MNAGALLATVLRGSGGAGTPFTPLALGSNLVGWWQKGVGRFESSDESDPAAANGDLIRRWSDQSGTGNHLLQGTANIRPVRHDDYVGCYWRTDGADLQAWLGLTWASALSRDSLSGGVVVDAPCSSGAPIISFGNFAIQAGRSGTSAHQVWYFDGTSTLSTSLPSSGKRMRIVWSNGASGLKIMVNGTLFSAAALAAESLTASRIGSFTGGNPKPMRFVELFVGSREMTSAEMTGADAYLLTKAGALGTGTGKVVVYGDSITAGLGSDLMLPWPYLVTSRDLTHEWRIYGHDGAGFWSAIRTVTAAQIAAMVTTGDVVVLDGGVNDMLNGRTGAQLFTDYDAYRSTIQATGAKVVGVTLQDMATDTEAQNFNTSLNGAGTYDAIADVRTALPDCTDTSLFTDDQVHPKDAGHAAKATAIQTALASV